jgi:hypothetical protein
LAQANKSFSDYYADALAKQPVAAAAPPIVRKKLVAPKGKPKKSEGNDPISWLLDMVSRPLYAATNTVDAAMNAGSKASQKKTGDLFDKGDVLGGIGSIAGNLGDVLSAPVRGLLSTDKKDKHTTSRLIEKGTDTVGAFDPKYKDVEDNVNPWLKGGLGLAGDILGDPLTYVPVAGIVAAGSKIKSLAKGGAAVAGDATKAVTEGIKARNVKNVDTEAPIPTTIEPVKSPDPIDVPTQTIPEQAVVPDLPVAPSPLAAVAKPAPLPDAPSVQLAGAKKLPAAQTFLETLKTPPAAPAVGGPDWAKFPGGKMPSQSEWHQDACRQEPVS